GLKTWFESLQGVRPNSFFFNLDVLAKSGEVLGFNHAYEAIFMLIEATRQGVVLGLADGASTTLPSEIERQFDDVVRLTHIESKRFLTIIPRSIGEKFGEAEIPEGPLLMLASRLQWSDPIRAVKYMIEAEKGANSIAGVIEKIQQFTRPQGYIVPALGKHEE